MPDELTNLPTHRDLAGVAGFESTDRVVAIFVDIASLVWVSASFGYLESDAVIIAIARWVAEHAAAEGGVALRVGGDEFLLLLPASTHERAGEIARRLARDCDGLRLPFPPRPGWPPHVQINAVVTRVARRELENISCFRERMAEVLYQARTVTGRLYGVVAEDDADTRRARRRRPHERDRGAACSRRSVGGACRGAAAGLTPDRAFFAGAWPSFGSADGRGRAAVPSRT